MEEITKENLSDLKFDGIIVAVNNSTNKLSFVFECAFYSKGKHGYPKRGSKPDVSSFYTVSYDHEYLPNGLFFNSTSRLDFCNRFNFDVCTYYKFSNLKEFCSWYLEQNDANKEVKHVCSCNKPQKRKDKYADVLKLIDFKLNISQLDCDIQVAEEREDISGFRFLESKYKDVKQQLSEFLNEEV